MLHLKGAAASAQQRLRITWDATGSLAYNFSYCDAPTSLTSSSTLNPDSYALTASITGAAGSQTIADGPTSAGTTRSLIQGTVWNDHASVSQTVTLDVFDGTNAGEQWKGVLAPGESVLLDNNGQWIAYDNAGRQKVSAGPGTLIGMTVLTSGTTFTTNASTNRIRVRLRAGGGGGGGCSSAASQAAYGGGGAEGGYAEKIFTVSPNTGYTYAIGAAGAAGANTGGTGGTGGNTTFAVGATTVTANGGLGGVGMTTGTSHICAAGGASPAVSTNGDFNGSGTPGGPSHRSDGTNAGQSGQGGGMGGGASRTTGGAGVAGLTNTGGGGGGGAVLNGSGAVTGGAGGSGYIIVEEFT
jgi:hypothetical protein